MTNDFRTLIETMAIKLDVMTQMLKDDKSLTDPLADRARAALAEGETVPSDEELESFLLDVAAKAGDIYWAEPLVLARAVLARYGTTPPRPVPVSERLPGAEDCDAEGRCWLRRRYEPDGITWRLLSPESVGRAALDLYYVEWLPAHAIPLPQENTND